MVFLSFITLLLALVPELTLNIQNMPKKNQAAQKMGKAFAHLQSLMDDVFAFGFKKIKEVGEDGTKSSKVSKKPKTLGQKGSVFLKKTARFFGQTGESFYKEYEVLKAKKSKK